MPPNISSHLLGAIVTFKRFIYTAAVVTNINNPVVSTIEPWNVGRKSVCNIVRTARKNAVFPSLTNLILRLLCAERHVLTSGVNMHEQGC